MSRGDDGPLGAGVGVDEGVDGGVAEGVPVAAAPVAADSAGSGDDGPSVAGLGVDIIEIERMERALTRTPRMLQRIFSEQEREYAKGKSRPFAHYALFFAAKEAVLKALGTGFAGMNFTDVEVGHDRFGRPIPLLHGNAAELAKRQGIVELQLSLSYSHSVGVASAVAIKEQDRPRKDEKLDPRVELARQFKEMRAMLDDMDERIKALDDEGGAGQGEEPAEGGAVPSDRPADGGAEGVEPGEDMDGAGQGEEPASSAVEQGEEPSEDVAADSAGC